MRFLAAALLAHAVVVAPFVMSAARARVAPRTVADDAMIIDVQPAEVEAEKEDEAQGAERMAQSQGAEREARAQGAERMAQAQSAERMAVAMANAPPIDPHAPASSAPPPEPAPSGWTPGITAPTRVDIGLGGGVAFKPGDAPPDKSGGASATPNTGGVREALHARDLSLGIGSGGAVVGVAHSVAMSAPMQEGTALLEIDADAAGAVRSCRVTDVAADMRAWNDIANGICASMKGRTLPVPRDSRGVVVALRIEIAMRLPSGARAGHGVSYGLGPGTFGGQFDLADIGAKPKKAVHARIVGERRL